MKFCLFSAAAIAAAALAAPSHAATAYAIDFDSTRTGSSSTAGSIDTETGFTSLDVTNGGSASVNVSGIDFELFTTNVNASRRRAGPNPLTRDFIFEEGGNNDAVGILIGGAGDLAAGTWQVEVWAWDADISAQLDAMIIGSRKDNAETIHTTAFAGSPTDPFTFNLVSDGTRAYDVFVRENNDANKTRMNAIRLTLVPEPGSLALLGLGGLALIRRRRG
ncbi:MAG: PEP-CTERM sorting domain-containing protein [Phycisphaeraceae bacterium]|nr:PEP-CTERM sorting domain-containing protein [Phycisphaeraceae bacterium]